MNRRHIWLVAAAALLLVLNIWHWWPKNSHTRNSAGPDPAEDSPASALRVEDFVIQGVPGGKLTQARRDVFQPKLPVIVKPPAPKKPSGPPPKSPEELEREAAQADYAQIRCLGLAFREGQAQALLSAGPQTFQVGVGGRVGSRFVVDKIESDGVVITDPKTGIGGKISMSGEGR